MKGNKNNGPVLRATKFSNLPNILLYIESFHVHPQFQSHINLQADSPIKTCSTFVFQRRTDLFPNDEIMPAERVSALSLVYYGIGNEFF